jgi:RND family efflux transporter MFP subunit
MYVTPEMELYTVTELATVWVWADVYEDEIGLVRSGQAATISLASDPGRTRSGVVSYVNPTLEPATRTLRVRFDVENGDGDLKPGMYATVEIETPLGDVLALPEDAVIDTGERKVVFVAVDGGRFQPREVRIGRKAQGYYEILDGLALEERVVVSAQFLLDSESRIRAGAGGPAHSGH